MKYIRGTIAILSITVLIGMGSFGIMSMDGHHHERGCLFMPGKEVICQMDVFDHISAWRNIFATVLPTFGVGLFLITAIFVIWKYCDPLDLCVRILLRRWRFEPARVSIIQELFSSRNLNPRAP